MAENLTVVAKIHSPYEEKFGSPLRYSSMAGDVRGIFRRNCSRACPRNCAGELWKCLRTDPRAAYQKKEGMAYGMRFGGYEIKFTVSEETLTVLEVFSHRG